MGAFTFKLQPKLKEPANRVTGWKDCISKKLPSYMVPSDFVILGNFPLTPNGKIDRKSLPRPYLLHDTAKVYVAPRNKDEKLIADIWSKLLGYEKVSITDDFFEIGGHSSMAVQAMVRIEKESGVRLPISILFESSTVEKLALKLRSGNKNW